MWEYDPRRETLTLIFESPGPTVLDGPDNVVIVPRTGDIFLQEDAGGDQFIRGVTTRGEIFDFAATVTNDTRVLRRLLRRRRAHAVRQPAGRPLRRATHRGRSRRATSRARPRTAPSRTRSTARSRRAPAGGGTTTTTISRTLTRRALFTLGAAPPDREPRRAVAPSAALSPELARRLAPAARELVAAAGVGPGMRVLDVGGDVALAAAAAGADVTAIRVAGVERTPFDDGEFDAVLSSFGAIFWPRPRAAVAELARVGRPGAPIALTAFMPGGRHGAADRRRSAPDAGPARRGRRAGAATRARSCGWAASSRASS